MAQIVWDNSFSVGVKLIDAQHKKLFSILNELELAVNSRRDEDPALLENIVYALHAYVDFHFGEEEKYFQKFNYQEADPHQAEHRTYEEKIQEFHKNYLSSKAGLAREILTFLQNWIQGHIKTIDKKYTKCFNDHGLI
ncbi:MAG: bacteriohemerythrin [Candidatus Margulisiibacteriota bacterium]